MRGSAVVERLAHNQQVVGAIPTPATKLVGIDMPIYEYECKKCNKIFEQIVAYEKSKTAKCNTCNTKCKRIEISSGGFILKGKGFYKPSRD